jgi:type III pantothenate kinase
VNRLVADLGNTRLKVARVDRDLSLLPVLAHDLAWEHWPGEIARLAALADDSTWNISSVNPPAGRWLADVLSKAGVSRQRWYRSAADVPIAHELDHTETAGADRALAVVGALARSKAAGAEPPGLVVACGTALTVERIDRRGVWTGGAIAPGLKLMSAALHAGTAQLPEIVTTAGSHEVPPWGNNTRKAIEAGITWSLIGTARELIARQRESLDADPWVLWTGGDSLWLAARVQGDGAWIAPDLVLEGLARGGANKA